ncbi:MAG: MATE family efflux transporter [Planctomycetaceae bacterium]|nr:MATE family efflux transporter [Planctomycetaceae bacterium]
MSAISTRTAHTNALGTQPIGKLIAKFAIPGIVSMVVMSLYNIVDQLFIGHGVGYLGNAATNIVFPVNVLTIAVSMLIGEGATAVYSIRLGEKRREEANHTVGNAIVMLAIIGVTFAVVVLTFLQPLLGFFGATPAIMPYAIDYAAPIAYGIPFLVIGPGMNAIIRANGSPGYAMKSMLTGAIVNTILDPIFIFTFGMGVKGAAIATAISQFISFCVVLNYYIRGNRFGLAGRHFRLSGGILGKLLSCGIPPSVSQLAVMVVIVTVNKSMVEYGGASKYGAEICLAAHGITMKVNQILFSVLIGLSIGAQPIIGFNFGARNYDRVRRAYLLSVALATCVGVAGFIAFFFFPQYLIAMFGNEDALYNEFARQCFRVFLFCAPLNGFTILTATFFQSMARAVHASVIQLSRQILFMIPAVHFLPQFFGVRGVLLAGPITDAVSFLLALSMVIPEFRRLRRRETAGETEDLTLDDDAEPVSA